MRFKSGRLKSTVASVLLILTQTSTRFKEKTQVAWQIAAVNEFRFSRREI